MNSRTLRNLDWILLLVAPTIALFGVAAIFSAAGGGKVALSYVQKQVSTVVVGMCVLAIAAALDDHVLPRLAGVIYWLNAGILLLVDVAGRSVQGAQRWIMIGGIQIQPSEFAKVAVIITLSVFFLRHYDEIRDFRTVLKSLVHIAVPVLLIFKQPDLGTSLVICAVWLGVALAGGVPFRHILVLVTCAVVVFVIAWHSGLIRDYQKQRLASFVDPDADPRGAGYHLRQSRIAIGSGQLLGKGYRHGTQSQLNFIPEQQTDFIFTVVGEELGFLGGASLILLYWLLVSRALGAMQSTEERLGRMLAGGVLSMLLFHIFVNLGMTLGIMPVTGVPLPLFSYGRSNLLATMLALGLVLGVYTRRHRIAF